MDMVQDVVGRVQLYVRTRLRLPIDKVGREYSGGSVDDQIVLELWEN